MRYDKKLEVEIEEAKKRGDHKTVFTLGLELNAWRYEK